MSDTAPQGEALQGQPPAGTESAPPDPSGQGSSNEYSLASDFLQQIPEAHREIVSQYVPAWDAGVTRRFQALHQEVAPYKELGDAETLQQALQVYRLMDESPEVILAILQQELGQQTPQPTFQQPVAPQSYQPQGIPQGFQTPGQPPVGGGFAPSVPGQSPQFQGLPPEIMEKIQLQETVLSHVAQFVIEQQQQATQAQEDMALEQELTLLKTQYGDFDEDYVLSLAEAGMDLDKAVQTWQQKRQEIINSAAASTAGLPPTLNGGGTPPGESQSVVDMKKNETRNLVASLVSQAAANEK